MILKKLNRDRSKIVLEHEDQIKHWSRHLGVTRDELTRVVEKVGNSAAAVRSLLQLKGSCDYDRDRSFLHPKKRSGLPIPTCVMIIRTPKQPTTGFRGPLSKAPGLRCLTGFACHERFPMVVSHGDTVKRLHGMRKVSWLSCQLLRRDTCYCR
jgi:hypothetical protein